MSATPILSYETLADPPGIELVDQLEQVRCRLHTPDAVVPREVERPAFIFPVGEVVSVTTDAIVLPNVVSVFVRDSNGRLVEEVGHLDSVSMPEREYVLDLGAQIKTYVEVSGPVEITANAFEVRIEFDVQEIAIGFRSRHTRPAATITTPADPHAMMEAISYFGSALKTTSPERAFPTLRGHPPRVELGESLSVPPTLEQPETGVSIEVPPDYEALYPVVTLAYYLGARVEPGARPRLVTEDGFEYSFDEESYERSVAETLKQLVLLDCLVRTEGYYNIALHERAALADDLDFEWRALYDSPLAERLSAYLGVSYETVAAQVPEWRLTAHVQPRSESVEQLPFVVDKLATVRTATPTTAKTSSVETQTDSTENTVFTRAASSFSRNSGPQSADQRQYVQLEQTDALEQGWVGDGVPIGASKLLARAFENRLDRVVPAGDIAITIVVNDTRMDEERNLVDKAYGDRENLPFDIDVHRDLSGERLRELLREDHQFLHYIGHTEAKGFECSDGYFDAGELSETGVEAFLLNACDSYEQGVRLIEAGAIGGITTLNDIINHRAVRVGELIAQLVNAGFPLAAAVHIASEETILGKQYIVVGDGGMSVTQAEGRTITLVDLEDDDSKGTYSMKIRTYNSENIDIGSIYKPHLPTQEQYYLNGGVIDSFSLDTKELVQFLDLAQMPVRYDGSLEWSDALVSQLE